jgi:murein DD-endopeptidase MepM/ murein hydrolase activator NlpD
MNIIITSESTKTKSFNLNKVTIFLLTISFFLIILFISLLISYVFLKYSVNNQTPFLKESLNLVIKNEVKDSRKLVDLNLKIMRENLVSFENRIKNLEFLSHKIAESSGINLKSFKKTINKNINEHKNSEVISMSESLFDSRKYKLIDNKIKNLDDSYVFLEQFFYKKNSENKTYPSGIPIKKGSRSSNFGWRIDPFTKIKTFHEGTDFVAKIGEPILAAAGGFVIFAGSHYQYGNMIDIDHGNGLTTRYAHANKLLVNVGELVLPGEKIALVGSTGRSTGPHLHYEIRKNNIPRNPNRYLSRKVK